MAFNLVVGWLFCIRENALTSHPVLFWASSLSAPVENVVDILVCHVLCLPLSFSIAKQHKETWGVVHPLARQRSRSLEWQLDAGQFGRC